MDTAEIKGRIGVLRKESEEKKHERKLLATDYEKLQKIVKNSGITALITFLVHTLLLNPWANNHKHITLVSLGRFLTPFALLIFLVSFIIFLIKGFDLFVNADNKYSKMAAEKFKMNRVAEDLRIMNDAITMLDIEIDRLENALFEKGETLDGIEIPTTTNETAKNTNKQQVKSKVKTKVQKKDITIEASERVERPVVKRTVIEKPKPVVTDTLVKKTVIENKKDNIDDIFSGLDDLTFADDEDEFESSSEMWEREAMKRFR